MPGDSPSSSRLKIPPTAFDADEPTVMTKQEYPPIEISLPQDGSVNKLPLLFRCGLAVDGSSEFFRLHGGKLLCVEVDETWKRCVELTADPPVFPDLASGNHSAVAFLEGYDENGNVSVRLLDSEPVKFTVLSGQEYREYVERRTREEREKSGVDQDLDQNLLAWASAQASSATKTTAAIEREITADGEVIQLQAFASPDSASNMRLDGAHQPLVLVIGVKTSVLHGFPSRQAIRSTWANKASLENLGVKVYFIGCQPVITEEFDHGERREALIRAVEMEKQQYGDLLTDEVECEDSYFTLPTKVKEFLHFAVTKHPQIPYVMIADDDIYLRVDQLADALRTHGPRTKFYAGQVWTKQFLSTSVAIQRNADSKNYLPENQYPMSDLPPFAIGPHYVMSTDCAKFIARNRHLG